MAACGGLCLGLTSASAQYYYPPPAYHSDPAREIGFYLNGDVGPSFVQDFNSSRFGFPGSFSTRPGVRFGVEPGFNFLASDSLTLGAEFETGVIYNYISSIRNAGAGTNLRGDLYQVPVLGNLVLKLNTDSFVLPYLGVGGGGDYSSVSIRNQPFFHFGNSTTDDEFDPAVQAMVGVRFRITPISEVGVGYKFLAAFPNEGSTLTTHAVQASFTLHF